MRPVLSALLVAAAAIFAASSTFGSILAHADTPPMAHMTMAPAAPSAPVAATTVQIRDYAFQPASIVVAPGDAVTWTNADDEPHTVTANDHAYHSTPLDTDQRFTHVFAAPGEYHYFCSMHPHMTGVVIVRAPAAARGN